MIENMKETWELIDEDLHQTIGEPADTFGISYGVCQESLTENLNMSFIAPTHMSLKTTESLTNNRAIIPNHPYLLDLAPCDFSLFPNVKLKLKNFLM
jgi:predicted transcriptional regulator YdeE